MKSTITTCSTLKVNRSFRETYRLHLQGQISRARCRKKSTWLNILSLWSPMFVSKCSSNMNFLHKVVGYSDFCSSRPYAELGNMNEGGLSCGFCVVSPCSSAPSLQVGHPPGLCVSSFFFLCSTLQYQACYYTYPLTIAGIEANGEKWLSNFFVK
jgi:hypothetical protein